MQKTDNLLSEDSKNKITGIVEEYINKFPDDYVNVCTYILGIRNGLKDDKFASIDRKEHFVSRHLGEIPELLYGMLKIKLNDDEFKNLLINNNRKNLIWFYNKFNQFRIPEKI